MENFCENLVKYFMVLANILFALAGVALIGFGAYAQIAAKDYLNFLGDSYVNTPIVIIILGMQINYNFLDVDIILLIGGIIFGIAFFGCCGAWKEKKCLLYTYIAFLVIILIAQVRSVIC